VEGFRERGAGAWALQAFRELEAAILHLRFNLPEIGLVAIKTQGDRDRLLAVDAFLAKHREADWFVNEIVLFQARTLRRVDQTARSFFALIEPGSCFAGSLLELALAADRSYLLEDGDPQLATSALNAGAYPMAHCLSRLQVRFASDPAQVNRVLEAGVMGPAEAGKLGMVTAVLDDIDYEDEVRVAMEERASLSPDALTGMEASLRFPGAENCDSKIFGRLSAWQNWIFFRPNAVGEKGALKLYGHPERPEFDWKRT
jgi:benzoyl-CoA-dihydrodiol lyase